MRCRLAMAGGSMCTSHRWQSPIGVLLRLCPSNLGNGITLKKLLSRIYPFSSILWMKINDISDFTSKSIRTSSMEALYQFSNHFIKEPIFGSGGLAGEEAQQLRMRLNNLNWGLKYVLDLEISNPRVKMFPENGPSFHIMRIIRSQFWAGNIQQNDDLEGSLAYAAQNAAQLNRTFDFCQSISREVSEYDSLG
jgi:hypothetical protein